MTIHDLSDIPCEDVIRNVWDYLDHEIDAGLKERIRRHLEACDHCRDQYTFEGELLRALGRLVEGTDDEVAPLRARIEHALTEHGFPKA